MPDPAPVDSLVPPTQAPPAAPAGPRVRTFVAFRHRNYRLWFAGQLTSLFGTWMQTTAQGYLVYQLTHSPAYLGYVGFASGIPSWLLMLYGGVMSDRVPRRTILVLTQTAMMALAFVLATLTFTGLVQPWHLLVLAFGLGLANAFDAPARQAFVSELVDREDMTNAIALNSTMFNMATAVGPAVAGVTYELFGPGWCFTLNGLSFLAVIAALVAMRFDGTAPARPSGSVGAQLKEALGYIASEPTVRALVSLVALISWLGISCMTLMPAWAVSVLHGDARTNGLLLSARGVGALAAALLLASLGRFTFRGRLLTLGTFTIPVCMIAFAGTRTLAASLAAVAAAGWAMILVNNLSNALVQTAVPDAMRGRVMGVYTLTFFGMMPIGALTGGALAERIGVPGTFVTCAILLALGAAIIWTLVPRLRALR